MYIDISFYQFPLPPLLCKTYSFNLKTAPGDHGFDKIIFLLKPVRILGLFKITLSSFYNTL